MQTDAKGAIARAVNDLSRERKQKSITAPLEGFA
jgi:hypothetical protein